MTAADWIDNLERKAKAATPGPWVADHSEEDNSAVKQEGRAWWDGLAFCGRPADAKFIAAANPTTILRLIEDNRRMRHGSLCPECNAKAWGERADFRRERDELAARLAAVEAVFENLPIFLSAIEKDQRRTPEGRGGEAHFIPATPGHGKSGCPGDNITSWLNEVRAALSAAPTDTTKEQA